MSPEAKKLKKNIADKKEAYEAAKQAHKEAKKKNVHPLRDELRTARRKKRVHTAKTVASKSADVGLGGLGGIWGTFTGFFQGLAVGAISAGTLAFQAVAGTPIQSIRANHEKSRGYGPGLFARGTKANGKKKLIPGSDFASIIIDFWEARREITKAKNSALLQAERTYNRTMSRAAKVKPYTEHLGGDLEKLLKREVTQCKQYYQYHAAKKKAEAEGRPFQINEYREGLHPLEEVKELVFLQNQREALLAKNKAYAEEIVQLRRNKPTNTAAIAFARREMSEILDDLALLRKQIPQTERVAKTAVKKKFNEQNTLNALRRRSAPLERKLARKEAKEIAKIRRDVANEQFLSRGISRGTNSFKRLGLAISSVTSLFRAAAAPLTAVGAGILGAAGGAAYGASKKATDKARKGYGYRQEKKNRSSGQSEPILLLPEPKRSGDQSLTTSEQNKFNIA